MSRFINPVPQYLNSAGQPLINGEMYFYEVGSVTEKDTYADASLLVPNSNPVDLDADGSLPDVYLSGTYRTVLVEPSTGERWERDNVGSDAQGRYGDEWDSTVTYNIPEVVLFDGSYYLGETNNNTGNDPSSSPTEWTELAFLTAAREAVSGNVKTRVVTVSDPAFIPSDNIRGITFTAVGGGGGGGGVDGQGVGTGGQSTSGAGGGTSIINPPVIDSTYAIIIGIGGSGAAAGDNAGDNGGDTSVISSSISISAPGGEGGAGMQGGATKGGEPSIGGVGSGGDVDISGTDGPRTQVITGLSASRDNSGCSIFGGSVASSAGATDGTNATTFGAGGGSTFVPDVSTNTTGGNGFQGVVIVQEFF